MIRSLENAERREYPILNHRSIFRAVAAFAFSLVYIAGSPLLAEMLGAKDIRDLTHRGAWVAQHIWGYWSWTWSENNTVCLRVFGWDGDCADTGIWNIDGNVMCYELTWWGEAHDVRKNCFTLHPLGGPHYEAHYHGGALDSVFTTFSVFE